MKIERIEVKNLFGIFYHEIPLNIGEHITLIHGPNGFGKTTLLTMLNALFSSNYGPLRGIPFSEFSLDFSDKSNLRLRKKPDLDNKELKDDGGKLIFEFSKRGSRTRPYVEEPLRRRIGRFPLAVIEEIIPQLDRIGRDQWIHLETDEVLSLEEIFDRFGDRLPFDIEAKHAEPDWLQKIKSSIGIRFIEAQRLLSFPKSVRELRGYKGQPPMVPAVMNYSKELAGAIQAKLAEYGSLSQSLDRTFPTRLVKGNGTSELTIEELRNNLGDLEKKRSRLMMTGLLDKEEEIDLRELQDIDQSNRNVLSVYIGDVKEKLSVFDELTNKIDLLVKIINERFLYKRMAITKKEGFVFTTSAGTDLSPASLSSGEQHEVVLLYELLFKVGPNCLILIDEPELSLHVVWQQQFLKDLLGITSVAGFDVLIATHSPQIIHGRWDLTVVLQGPDRGP